MKYQVTYTIQEKRELVTKLFIDKKSMKSWEPGLIQIEENRGILFETGSEGTLVFDYGGTMMKMKVYVESNQLPKEIVLVYQMSGTWNRCVNTFKKAKDQTEWMMDVEFRFNEPQNAGLEKFIEQTAKGMEIFRDFVEGNKNNG